MDGHHGSVGAEGSFPAREGDVPAYAEEGLDDSDWERVELPSVQPHQRWNYADGYAPAPFPTRGQSSMRRQRALAVFQLRWHKSRADRPARVITRAPNKAVVAAIDSILNAPP